LPTDRWRVSRGARDARLIALIKYGSRHENIGGKRLKVEDNHV